MPAGAVCSWIYFDHDWSGHTIAPAHCTHLPGVVIYMYEYGTICRLFPLVLFRQLRASNACTSAGCALHPPYCRTAIFRVHAPSTVLPYCHLQGARSIRRTGARAMFVFVAPPSLEDLAKRLAGRATETPEQMQHRLGNAKAEINRCVLCVFLCLYAP